MPNVYNQIPETSYLTVEATPFYRAIMRMMFIEYERLNYQLYKEEIFVLLKENGDFSGYTMDDLKQHLDQLVEWHNLIAVQDPGIVHTIAEYKNKQYRYSMSEEAVEIERLTVKLENLTIESGNLSTNYFLRIEDALEQIKYLKNRSLQEVNEWWHTFLDDFQRLNQNYQDYLRDFYVADSHSFMQSMEFIIHKDRFIEYLNSFIKQMQLHARKIQSSLNNENNQFEENILPLVVESELDFPHANVSLNKENVEQNIRNRWRSFQRWFLKKGQRKPEYEQILDITNEIIRSIIENANLIVQMTNYGVSRKDDYKQFLKMFMNCPTLNDAHCLSAHVFGVQHSEHIHTLSPMENQSIYGSSYLRDGAVFELSSHSRTFKERIEKNMFRDKTFEKTMESTTYLENEKKKQEFIMKYVQQGKLEVSKIREEVPDYVRITLLSWISNANMNPSKQFRTEYGNKLSLKKEEGTCVLHCEDGDITMPKYVLEFDL